MTRVTALLDSFGISYELKPHSRPALTAAEAAAERGVRLSQIAKTMLVVGSGHCYAAVVPGDRRLDLELMSKAVGTHVQLLARDRVQTTTGFAPGSISPIGLTGVERVIVDYALFRETWMTISAGIPEVGLGLATSDLVRAADAEVLCVTSGIA